MKQPRTRKVTIHETELQQEIKVAVKTGLNIKGFALDQEVTFKVMYDTKNASKKLVIAGCRKVLELTITPVEDDKFNVFSNYNV